MLPADQRRCGQVQSIANLRDEPRTLRSVSHAKRETRETADDEIIARRRQSAPQSEQPLELFDGRVRTQLSNRNLKRGLNASQAARVSRCCGIPRGSLYSAHDCVGRGE